jgi:transcriptional regulator with XRE-family HTH domain
MSIQIFKISNAVLLDRVKEGLGYKTDLEIAGFLGVSKELISNIRNDKKALSLKQRIKIMDRLATIQIRDLLIKITPEYLGKELYRLSLRGAENLAFKESEEGQTLSSDIKLIDLFKEYGRQGQPFRTDEDMANYLGVSISMISSVRRQNKPLSHLSRLRILKAVNPDANTDQIERGIESSEYLLSLINEHIKQQKS